MKAISVIQPWASLLAIGAKRIETRSWWTSHRGWIAIHASKGFPKEAQLTCDLKPFAEALEAGGVAVQHFKDGFGGWSRVDVKSLPLGAIIAIGNLHRVERIYRTINGDVWVAGQGRPVKGNELAFGDFASGRYGWVITNVRLLPQSVPAKGARGLWDWEPPESVKRWQEGER